MDRYDRPLPRAGAFSRRTEQNECYKRIKDDLPHSYVAEGHVHEDAEGRQNNYQDQR